MAKERTRTNKMLSKTNGNGIRWSMNSNAFGLRCFFKIKNNKHLTQFFNINKTKRDDTRRDEMRWHYRTCYAICMKWHCTMFYRIQCIGNCLVFETLMTLGQFKWSSSSSSSSQWSVAVANSWAKITEWFYISTWPF